jgi:hypothetical protein
MSAKLRTHIRSNVIGYVALFFALSTGSAVALSGSNTVFTDDIVDNEVRTADVRNDSLTGGGLAAADLKAGSVGTSEVAADSLGAGDLAPSSVGSSEVANDSLTGADVNEATLGEVPSALLGGTGRSASDPDCDPNSTTFETCVTTSVQFAKPARVLVIATAEAVDNGATAADSIGNCQIPRIGTLRDVRVPNGTRTNFSVVGVTDPLPTDVVFPMSLECNETQDGIIFFNEQISAVALSAN